MYGAGVAIGSIYCAGGNVTGYGCKVVKARKCVVDVVAVSGGPGSIAVEAG